MTLQDLQALIARQGEGPQPDLNKIMQQLRGGQTATDLKDFRNQYQPSGHDSVNITKRPDKDIQKPAPTKEDPQATVAAKAKVNRLALSLQKIIVSRAVSFVFGNQAKIVSETEQEQEKKVLDALNRILYDNKTGSFDRRIARDMFRCTEIAECWFTVPKDSHEDYGFEAKFKLRVIAFSPWDGNELYPLFDESGDMIAFSRAYERTDGENKKIQYFETYTDSEKIVWSNEGAGAWQEKARENNLIGKIPVVYGRQQQVEWADVQTAIDRLEYLLSNFADTNDYHAAPKIFVEGEIVGFVNKGESGGILQGKAGAKASYLSWDHATDAVKLEIETLLRFIYSFTQTPDISFESVKGLNEISGEALKMLFLDAHLKVQEKREVLDEYLQRRLNIIKSFVGVLNTGLKGAASTLRVEAEIQPFMINDQKALVDLLSSATGGKALLSQKTAMALSGLVDDVDKEYEQLQEEQTRANTLDTFPPAV